MMSNKFRIDYDNLSNTVDKKSFKFSDIKHTLEKVAFDVYRSKDNPEELWQVQNSDDGDYIVAKYSDEEQKPEVKTASRSWQVLIEHPSDIHIFYKGQQITKLAAKNLGLNEEDLPTIEKYIPNKLATDAKFVKSLINSLDNASKEYFIKLYPELA